MIFFSFTAVAVLASRQYNLVVESGVGVWGEKNKCLIFFKLKQHLAHVFTSSLHHSFSEVGIKVIKEMTDYFHFHQPLAHINLVFASSLRPFEEETKGKRSPKTELLRLSGSLRRGDHFGRLDLC